MKKTISVIKIHSYISEITNSSTELFVCNTDKTIDTVKEILQKIIDGYNMMVDGSYGMNMFGEPYIFSIKEYREWKANDENDWDSKLNNISGWFPDDEDEDELKELRLEFIDSGDRSGGWWSAERNPFYERLAKACGETYDYNLRKKEMEKIYEEIEKEENKPDWWNKPWEHDYNTTLAKELDGCVIITGSYDNSVPYEIWDIINSKLNGHNYHLG